MLICVGQGGSATTFAAAAKSVKPNVVLIMADDMGYECLSCYGSDSYKTPNLDRLAAEGVRFANCHSQPLCTPSRVKIMTGKYNFRNYEEFGYLNPFERTFGHLLQQAGYRTCIAGKWQLNGLTYDLPGNQDATRPRKAGFHESCLWQLTKLRKVGERYADALIETDRQPASRRTDAYGPQVFTDFVCDFMERNQARPFFVYYPMVLTHDPFVPTPDSPEWQQDRHRRDNKFFAEMVAYTDKIVGQLDAKLAELGLRENTLLLFTGDNGTHRRIVSAMQDGRLLQGGKGKTTDAGTHVPLIASWPGTTPRGTVSTDLIDFTDFYATLAELADVPRQLEGTDGRSFLPQIRGEAGNPRDHLFCHYDPRWGSGRLKPARFARDHVYKLYHDGRLYNVQDDPLETNPLPNGSGTSAAAQEGRKSLQQVLDAMPPWKTSPRRPASPAAAALHLPTSKKPSQ